MQPVHSIQFVALVIQLLVSSSVQDLTIGGMLPPQPPHCNQFSANQGFKSDYFYFTTPNYPKMYPNNADCIKVIEGQANQQIELSFRSSFLIERSSECLSDYLEVRDGPYGFSPPLRQLGGSSGRLCGGGPDVARLPARSSGRHLWLRFRSDEVLRHQGVMAVFRFLPPSAGPGPETAWRECQMVHRLHTGRQHLVTTQQLRMLLPPDSQVPISCSVDLSSVQEDTRLLVAIATAEFRREGQCHANAIRVYDGFTARDRQREDFGPACGNIGGETGIRWSLLTGTPRAVLLVTARDARHLPAFHIAVTAVRFGQCQADTEFDCGAGRCIDSRLRCNGYANCPMEEDEGPACPSGGTDSNARSSIDGAKGGAAGTPSPPEAGGDSHHAIILGALGGSIGVAALVCCVCNLRRHRRRRCEFSAVDAAAVAPGNGATTLSDGKVSGQLTLPLPLPLFRVEPPPPPHRQLASSLPSCDHPPASLATALATAPAARPGRTMTARLVFQA